MKALCAATIWGTCEKGRWEVRDGMYEEMRVEGRRRRDERKGEKR